MLGKWLKASLIGIALVGGIGYFIGDIYGTNLNILRHVGLLPGLAIGSVLLVLGVGAAMYFRADNQSVRSSVAPRSSTYSGRTAGYSTGETEAATAPTESFLRRHGGKVLALALIIALGLLVLAGLAVKNADYHGATQYAPAVQVTEEAHPTFETRLAFPVVAEQFKDALADEPGTQVVGSPMYVPETGEWTQVAVVTGKQYGVAVDRVLYGVVAINGKGESRICEFSASTFGHGGAFGNRLERQVKHATRDAFGLFSTVTYDESDSYGFCTADGKGSMVLPLKSWKGYLPAYQVPAGIALIGERGDSVQIRKSVKAGEIPGPVYPLSLAAKQREATRATGTLKQWNNETKGYETTPGGEYDINRGNTSEFVLGVKGGATSFVTPLTPASKNGSERISGVSVIAANAVTAGELAPIVVHKVSRLSSARTYSMVKNDYKTITAFSSKDSVMQLVEMTPETPEVWTATFATDSEVSYILKIEADGSSCVYFGADAVQLQCGSIVGKNGNGVSGALAPAGSGTGQVGGDVTKLSDAEFAALVSRVGAEMARRSAQAGQAK